MATTEIIVKFNAGAAGLVMRSSTGEGFLQAAAPAELARQPVSDEEAILLALP